MLSEEHAGNETVTPAEHDTVTSNDADDAANSGSKGAEGAAQGGTAELDRVGVSSQSNSSSDGSGSTGDGSRSEGSSFDGDDTRAQRVLSLFFIVFADSTR